MTFNFCIIRLCLTLPLLYWPEKPQRESSNKPCKTISDTIGDHTKLGNKPWHGTYKRVLQGN